MTHHKNGESEVVAKYSKTPTTCCQNSRLLGVLL